MRPSLKTIETQQDIENGLAKLREMDPELIPIINEAGEVPLRRETSGFAGLSRIIIGQHVSTAAASAIHGRFIELIGQSTPDAFLDAGEEIWIEVGLTRAKQHAIASLAEAVRDEHLDLNQLAELPASEAIGKLVSLKGIGPWTAEVYLLFCAGHPDIFAAGDLAIREAVRHAYKMRERPPEKQLRTLSKKWSPYRGIATRLFWSYYASIKNGRSGQPV